MQLQAATKIMVVIAMNKSGGNVVIIDDNEMARTVLRLTLQGLGWQVLAEAADGDVGLQRVLALRPDVVCLDIGLPRNDGLDVLAMLRQFVPETAVIMVSASNEAETVRTALARGAAGFIVKPYSVRTVEDSMRRVRPGAQRTPGQGELA